LPAIVKTFGRQYFRQAFFEKRWQFVTVHGLKTGSALV
jgi:hypothetical protein